MLNDLIAIEIFVFKCPTISFGKAQEQVMSVKREIFFAYEINEWKAWDWMNWEHRREKKADSFPLDESRYWKIGVSVVDHLSGINASDLDHYLWLKGFYLVEKKKSRTVVMLRTRVREQSTIIGISIWNSSTLTVSPSLTLAVETIRTQIRHCVSLITWEQC